MEHVPPSMIFPSLPVSNIGFVGATGAFRCRIAIAVASRASSWKPRRTTWPGAATPVATMGSGNQWNMITCHDIAMFFICYHWLQWLLGKKAGFISQLLKYVETENDTLGKLMSQWQFIINNVWPIPEDWKNILSSSVIMVQGPGDNNSS